MGKRVLSITDDLVVSILKGLQGSGPRYFSVVDGALPEDTKVVELFHGNASVEILLESDEWSDYAPMILPCPVLEVVTPVKFKEFL